MLQKIFYLLLKRDEKRLAQKKQDIEMERQKYREKCIQNDRKTEKRKTANKNVWKFLARLQIVKKK